MLQDVHDEYGVQRGVLVGQLGAALSVDDAAAQELGPVQLARRISPLASTSGNRA